MPEVKIKIAYIISNIDRWMAFEWIEQYFQDTDIQIDFYLLSDSKGFFFEYLKERNQNVYWHRFNSKAQYPLIILWLSKHFISKKYSAIHCHFLDATVCGLTAGRICNVPKRIYTRHHSTSHHEYAKKGVIYDKLNNFLASKIVAISEVVRKVLIEKEGVKADKVALIHHGFKWDDIQNINKERLKAIREKYNLSSNFIVGVVSRFIELKGIQYIIPAFKEYLKISPESVLILANARGNYSSDVLKLLHNIPDSNYRIIPFENDIYALFNCFDIFIHVPINSNIEAFGQIYIEALALGIPSIMTKSGIGDEILKDHNNCSVVPFKDSAAILQSLKELTNNPLLINLYNEEGPKSVLKVFEIEAMVSRLKGLYEIDFLS